MPKPQSDRNDANRRTFLKSSAAAVVAGGAASTLAKGSMVHGGADETLKVGLVGCGGRGTGAAVNASRADADCKITALCDIFPDRLEHSRRVLERQIGDQIDVDDMNCFTDFDGYQRLVQTDVDVVLLCTTPHFRPQQIKAAVDAGKHVFCEKPIAVDGPGVRSVFQTCRDAADKGLNIVSGLCWRYDLAVNETMSRIQDGAIGEIRAIQENYLTGTLWHRGRRPDWSEMEYQIRNWLYFTWLSGDHIVEQHIHSLDKALWLNGDTPPARCFGLGGRQVRTGELWGNIYDHFAVCYEWESGVKAFAYTRQMEECANDVEDYVLGTEGKASILANTIDNADGHWKYRGPTPSMYDVEHQHLFRAIRAGEPINNGDYMCYSTMMAIIGRDACYTGAEIEWEAAWNSEERLGPETYEWGDVEVPPVPMPGSLV